MSDRIPAKDITADASAPPLDGVTLAIDRKSVV